MFIHTHLAFASPASMEIVVCNGNVIIMVM